MLTPEAQFWIAIIGAVFFGIMGVVNTILAWLDRKDTRERDKEAAAKVNENTQLTLVAAEHAKETAVKIDKIGDQTNSHLTELQGQNSELKAANQRLEQMISMFTMAQAASANVILPVSSSSSLLNSPGGEPIAVKTMPGDHVEVAAPIGEPLKVEDQAKNK